MPLLLYAEQWRLHPTFDGDVERIIDTPDYTYILSNNQIYMPSSRDNASRTMALFKYDKEAEELIWLNKQNHLSGTIVQAAEYNFTKRYLLVAYSDGNVDLIHDDGEVMNVPGFKMSSDQYATNVNGVSFWPNDNQAFLATDFGYVVINDADGSIAFSRVLGKGFNSATRIGKHVILTNEEGLYKGLVNDRNFLDFEKNDSYRDVYRAVRLSDNKLIVNQIYGWDGEVRCLEVDDAGNVSDKLLVNYYIKSLEPNRSGVTIAGFDEIWNVDESLNLQKISKDPEDKDSKASSWDLKDYFISKGRDGLIVRTPSDEGWVVKNERILPNASNAFISDNMCYHPQYGLLVRNHGIDNKFVSIEVNAVDGISALSGLTWYPMSTTYKAPSPMFEQWNPRGISVDPLNPQHVYSGSSLHGLMRLDLENPEKSLRLGRANDAGNIGDNFVVIQREFEKFSNLCSFSTPMFDTYGNMWTSWYDFDLYDEDKDALEIWYWSKEDRLATENASNFRPLKKWKVPGASVSKGQIVIPLKTASAKNILMYLPGGWEGYPVFIDHKGTFDNQDDDERVDIKAFTDQDGSTVEFSYIFSYYEDTATGQVWLGHDRGVFNFRPSEVMKTEGRVNRVKVSRNDGTNLADYLLDGVNVNSITVDPSGRKWFGTGGGGVVITSSDGTEILKTYTADNSELPDNTVYGICYNPENNSMMISTDKGLAELFLSTAAGGDSSSNVMAYPNPVRPDYFGYVTIEGLADNALVKIVDAGGGLIKEVGLAAGGEARWDVTNLNSKRVPGGVYYVLASGSPDGEGFSNVTKILVIN